MFVVFVQTVAQPPTIFSSSDGTKLVSFNYMVFINFLKSNFVWVQWPSG